MKKLYRFQADFGRHGDLTGLFTCDAQLMTEAMGKRVYFGEALGKHSEVWLDELTAEHVTELTEDPDFIRRFEEYKCASGYNPLHYIQCEACGETLEAPFKCDCECEK